MDANQKALAVIQVAIIIYVFFVHPAVTFLLIG